MKRQSQLVFNLFVCLFMLEEALVSVILLIISQTVKYLSNQLYSNQQSARAAVGMCSSIVTIVKLCLLTLLAMIIYFPRWVHTIIRNC